MGLMCGCDSDEYVELTEPEELVTSVGTEICRECGRLIHVGEEHYKTYLWHYNEYGDETWGKRFPVCEECGDLAFTVLQLGYCWNFGSLRNDVRETASLYG